MLISICIPHYNRAAHLLVVLESVRKQDYPHAEVIISDDCSTDDSSHVVPEYIAGLDRQCPIRFHYIRQPKNLGYDGNVRASLSAASGDYLFLLGNDDALANTSTLSSLAKTLEKLGYPDAALTNIHPYSKPDQVVRRAEKTAVIGSGPDVAVRTFRSFSFVGGVIFKNAAFKKHDTCAYDGSIFIQVYLAARIVASGGTLAFISESMVAKDVQIPGASVNSYLDVLERNNQTFKAQTGGLDQFGRVARDAILPYVPIAKRWRYIEMIYRQILSYTYPFWLFDFREHGVYKAAVNMALGCRPGNLVKTKPLPVWVHLRLLAIYGATTTAGLLMPLWFLEKMSGLVYRRSKAV